ncbi:MAG: flavodoxin-dependent (E)-4-hydroxy-3-methylbut-2-enyl-diphosphate synthase [Victivallales bacterium]|nr:flavodoxin-dependent (E)-4-hydroxy-3-methylbut-2-enyl-diphosphate synthase [Victivallales bacterium]
MVEKMQRRRSRQIKVGKIAIGGDAPVSVQSMTNTDTRDVTASLKQIDELAAAGCEIIRLAVPDPAAARALEAICAASPLPVIADIHFDYRLALQAIASGVDGIRLNPGNIGGRDRVRQLAEAAGEAGIPIRVGSNSGSISPKFLESLHHKHKAGNNEDIIVEALVESALEQCRMLEDFNFSQIKVSLKASSVSLTVRANRCFAEITDYPLHLGVTEAGTPGRGIVKSAVGIGSLLLAGIGDTVRVSLTADPVQEIVAGIRILEASGLRSAEPELVSCPTCGRTEINLIELAERVELLINSIKASGRKIALRKIAVMGCIVNGPGEAKDADLGIAGAGKGRVAVFKKASIIGTYGQEEAFTVLREEINKHTGN